MKISITQKQLEEIISKVPLSEGDPLSTTTPSTQSSIKTGDSNSPAPATSTDGDETSYPEVGHWETGVSRGPANQIGVTKWEDTVGSTLKRGKANQLK